MSKRLLLNRVPGGALVLLGLTQIWQLPSHIQHAQWWWERAGMIGINWAWALCAIGVSLFFRPEIAWVVGKCRGARRKGIAASAMLPPMTSNVTIGIRKAPSRSLWRRFGGWIAGQRRLKGVPDLQECLAELIKYSGFPVTTKVTSREIEASNSLFRCLQRACAILDKQGESHPKIEKGLTVTNHTEWIKFLAKRLAQDDAR